MNVRSCDSHPAGMILLAEDEPVLREVTKEFLEELGYRVIAACDGSVAVSQFKLYRDQIVLAIFDVMMPQLSGPEAAKQICALAPSLPFIFVTGCDRGDTLAKAGIPQGFQLLHKPVDFNCLSDVVRETIASTTLANTKASFS